LKGEGLEGQDVASIIVGAAKSILSTTVQLANSSLAAQKELLDKAIKNPRLNVFAKDPVWAQSLIDSAAAVAQTNKTFIASVNKIAQERNQEKIANEIENLLLCVRNAANDTQKLVAASKAKADSTSPSGKKLNLAGKAVNNATNSLLQAAKVAAQRAREEAALAASKPPPFKDRMEEKDSEIAIQLEIAKLEKELEKEKTLYLLKMGRAKELQKI